MAFSEESAPITAILRLDTSQFTQGITNANNAISRLEKTATHAGKNATIIETGFQAINSAVDALLPNLVTFNKLTTQVSNFNTFANGVKRIAESLSLLGSESVNAEQAITVMNNLIKQYQNFLSQTEIKVKGLKVSQDSLTSSVTTTDDKVKQFNTTLDINRSKINSQRIAFTASGNTAQAYATSLNSVNATVASTTQRQANMGMALRNTTGAVNSTTTSTAKLTTTYGVLNGEMNATTGKTTQLKTATDSLSASEQKATATTNTASSSIGRYGSSASTATAQANRLATANSRLAKTMSSLRMMGTLVGSMLAYNFAHKLLLATGETIHAKSEMEGYFKMLNFGQKDINSFNNALTKTVQQFQRVNKYQLGETISSIGVEFDLSTKEMEKAMKVTSMVTSEYLRAGRTSSEASLAVKDVLQGQFQRLSRETGVKGEQLKEAGWSGDTTDVLSLMDALEKVGKSRHWDVFASKANSLNDILTISQNRFGEWSAEMVYKVQPMIVGAFNMMMGTADKFGKTISGLFTWLNGDGIENQVAKWTLLGTAITTVLGLLVSYRTGANLLQIAQMGLTGSISATVLGLEAETVANYGTLTAIKAKMLGVEAEKVAELSSRNAILAKVLGLDAEVVAQTSLKTAIIDNAFAQELQTLRLKGATAEELMNTLALYENNLAQKSTIGLLSAQALKLNMTTYATHGFTVALLEAKTGMDATRLASMGLIKRVALLGASMVAPTAIVAGFALAFGSLALQMKNSADEMGKFNELVNNGADMTKEARQTVEYYSEKQANLKKKLDETKEGSIEYYKVQQELTAVTNDLSTANANLTNTYKAYQRSVSAQQHYNDALTEMNTEHQNQLAEAYRNAGYSASESYEMANSALLDANNGAEQLRITLQKIKQLQTKGEQNTNYLLGIYTQNNIDLNDSETKKHLNDAVTLNQRAQDDLEKALTDDSFMGRMDGWFGYYETQLEMWINNIGATVQSNDWGAVFENIWKGIAHGFADLPLFKDFWGWVYNQIGVNNYAGQGWDAFGNIFNDLKNYIWNWVSNPENWVVDNPSGNDPVGMLFRSILDFDSESFNTYIDDMLNNAKQGIIDAWNNFISFDWLFGEAVSASDGDSSHPSFMEDLSNIIGVDVQTWIDNFTSDPLGTLGVEPIDLAEVLFPQLFVIGDGVSGLMDGVASFLGLGGDDAESEAQTKGESIGTNFNTGIQTGLTGVDEIINNAMSGLGLDEVTSNFTTNSQNITSTATSTASNVATSYTTMKNNQKSSLDSMVSYNSQQFNAMKEKNNTSLHNMRDSTSTVTQQMVSAWRTMKDNIVASAEKIKTDSETRFNNLSSTIGAFYRKIQNPSSWGSAGSPRFSSTRTNPRVGRAFTSSIGHYAGGYDGSSTMTIGALKRKLCPNGDCDGLFDAFDNTTTVDVGAFLSLIGEGHGFGGWTFADSHNRYIKDKSDKWGMKSPVINLLGGIATNAGFKVGEFNNGAPKISWNAFQGMAESIFSTIPYKFYYDSSWKGNWLSALQAGACNCWDGAHALIAFAQACGFDGGIVHGTWTDPDGTQYPHVWATINGKKMDTTAWQQRGSWSAGSPNTSSTNNSKTVNVNVTITGDVYGIDDLNSKIEEGVDKGLRKHFNPSYTVGI